LLVLRFQEIINPCRGYTIGAKVGSNNCLCDMNTMHHKTSEAKEKIPKAFENVFVVLVSSEIILANFQVHKR